MTAAEQLTRALLDLADHGHATPCQGRHRERWTSDDATDRAWAAAVCVGLGCPVLIPCGNAGDEHDEKHYVFGGRDRTPAPPARKRICEAPPRRTKPNTQRKDRT